ncbi:HAD-IIB family hydrolase [Acidithiobacillus sp.]
MTSHDGFYILMLSLHGRIRGEPELGVDADTGGQVSYVLDLIRAAAKDPAVAQVDLLTRRIMDVHVDAAYALEEESLGKKARIVRLPFGPRRYLRKELLWAHLDCLVDRCLQFIRAQGRIPDIIHSHYADAGYVGVRLARLLGVPLVHTGHSLGRSKRERLLAAGHKETTIDREFHFPQRIAAEEEVLNEAALVIASTQQEVEEQYGRYAGHQRVRYAVMPPGVHLSRFAPGRRRGATALLAQLRRFLQDPARPPILAIARPDEKKNFSRLLQAYGESAALQARVNLILIMGQREDLKALDHHARQVIEGVLQDIDRYDLYGKVAIPKHHEAEDIPEYYRFAAAHKGVFINPALTEPFGLTLLEAAASGLPVVATANGGPQEILRHCHNGLLVDPLDIGAIGNALVQVLEDGATWRRWARNGLNGVRRVYNWDAHAGRYLMELKKLLRRQRKSQRRQRVALHEAHNILPLARQVIMTDIDNTLVGDAAGTRALLAWLDAHPQVAFGVATGRNLKQTLSILKEHEIPRPDILITDVGTRIVYGAKLRDDLGWAGHLRHRWWRDGVLEALRDCPGLRLQEAFTQSEFKVSYFTDPRRLPPLPDLRRRLRGNHIAANLVFSHGRFLDVLPARASKGHAIRFLAFRWGLPLGAFLAAGDSGNDIEMLGGEMLGVVVGNHSTELAHLQGSHHVYFAQSNYAFGILEGIEHYGFAKEKSP